ncbi:transposase [Rhodovulum visakhapatnamense]|uniref:Transposase n=2 Tax=Rhodovulum visakhapatnamense TaxID=364297 RepID=A0ABS1RGR7_9RHOB|nr:transposase [Rhodovulum visakhapatnamense]MBL3568327.1 transposase [Rhodovulum visakhapatnamense]MBL3578852.1 transposase [Rhodovulum visakhapatnamense]
MHGVDDEGKRGRMPEVFHNLPDSLVGMEDCASAQCWARELTKLGHGDRLMQPSCVKGYVKRGKTDKADAELICGAVSWLSMHFDPVKAEERRDLLMSHKAREFLVRQRTLTVNGIQADPGL